MGFDLKKLKKATQDGNLEWKKHVTERLVERGITRIEVLAILNEGDVIREYTDDTPCPSALFLGLIEKRPVHVVAAYDEHNNLVHIVTAYEPSLGFFMDDFKTKRK